MSPKGLPRIIETHDLLIRQVREEDAALMFQEIDDDRERLGRFLPWVDSIKTLKDEINFVRDAQKKWLKCEQFNYAIFLKPNLYYVGNISVHSLNWDDESAEIGYWILGKQEGKGLMLESVNRLTQILFHEGLHRIQIRCDAENIRSTKVPERAGFHFEGMLLNEQKLAQGIFRSTMCFSKTK